MELPRPDDPKPGLIILNPDATTQEQFKLHSKFESGDVCGCLRAKDLEKEICGTVGFDSGGPSFFAVTEEEEPPNA